MAKPASLYRVLALAALLISLCISLLPGCRSTPSRNRGSIDVTVNALTASPVAVVRLTVQSPSVLASPLRVPLPAKGGKFAAVINNLAAADDYIFSADALDGSGKVIAYGVAVKVSIIKGKTARVIIYLNDIRERPPFSISSPLIDAITVSAISVLPGGQVTLAALAHDPDPGQTATLVFSWIPGAGCGSISDANTIPGTDFGHPSESRATWTAPQSNGSCLITLNVKDILNLENSGSFVITVEGEGTGAASVVVAFNEAPTILGITANPAQISTDGPTSGVVAVLATDPEDDTLSYSWSSPPDSPCTILLETPTENTTRFTITATAAGTTSCTFLVAVSDGVWPGTSFVKNVSTASLTLALTRPLEVQRPPIFSISYQSADSATAGTLVLLATTASDPAHGQLSFTWSSSAGAAPVTTDPQAQLLDRAFSTAATWRVPEAMDRDVVISVTATSSASKLQSSLSFSLAPATPP
jgi:hypothetical protein